MDVIKILKRSWHILWSYRALWVFGVILAMTVGGTTGSLNNTVQWQEDFNQPWYRPDFRWQPTEDWREVLRQAGDIIEQAFMDAGVSHADFQALIWIGLVFLILMVLLSIGLAVLRYVSETALIRMVDEYERAGEKAGIRKGFRFGWSRASWRLFLINLLISLPFFFLVALFLLAGWGIYLSVSQDSQTIATASIVAIIGVIFLLVFLAIILAVVFSLLRHFFWRACVLEGLGVTASIRRGFDLVKRNWRSVGLMWLVMIGLGIAFGVVSLVAFFLLIPVMIFTALGGVVVGGIPALIATAISSIFLGGWLPWVVGALLGAPLFLLVTFLPLMLWTGFSLVFTSSVWTLVYRELAALEEVQPTAGQPLVEEIPPAA